MGNAHAMTSMVMQHTDEKSQYRITSHQTKQHTFINAFNTTNTSSSRGALRGRANADSDTFQLAAITNAYEGKMLDRPGMQSQWPGARVQPIALDHDGRFDKRSLKYIRKLTLTHAVDRKVIQRFLLLTVAHCARAQTAAAQLQHNVLIRRGYGDRRALHPDPMRRLWTERAQVIRAMRM